VLEPLAGYLGYAEAAVRGRDVPPALNFGPELDSCRPVLEVVERVLELAGKGTWAADEGLKGREAKVLRLDASLAGRVLGWRPVLDLDTALQWTVEWFRTEWRGGDLVALCNDQIDRYLDLA
jgi:CDP-glucose 4,6-dehydratase